MDGQLMMLQRQVSIKKCEIFIFENYPLLAV
jgi:hypothetical protein